MLTGFGAVHRSAGLDRRGESSLMSGSFFFQVFSRICTLLLVFALMSCEITSEFVSTSTPTGIERTQVPSGIPEITETRDEFTDVRLQMVATQIEARGVSSPEVLEAMRSVPRHLFVPVEFRAQAYDDHPLPIGYGQTISQPYIVALMTEALQLKPGNKVLEIGTGSGYQAAVLAEMGMTVYSIEIIPELAERAGHDLAESGYPEVKILNADGYFGWLEFAPFDAIIVTAAPDHLPQPLVGQLKDGARLVIPIGPIGAVQSLWLFHLNNGDLQAENLGAVQFVPFTRE